MIRYSEEHQWIKAEEDGTYRVGITAFAAEELGEITFVELPEIGTLFSAGEQLCVVESVKAASDVFAPAGGEVIDVNQQLEMTPELLNEAAEGEGWICRLSKVEPAELKKLMDIEAYRKFCAG